MSELETRHSGLRSRQRFTWGDVYPRGWPEGPDRLHAECLIEGDDPTVEVTVRFRHVVTRQVLDARGEPVAELLVAGKRHLSDEETVEREVRLPSLPDRTAAIATAGEERRVLTEGGMPAGSLLWHWETLHGTVEAWFEEIASGLRRVRIEIANRLEWSGGGREAALGQTLRSTHAVLHSPDGSFVSLVDPSRRREMTQDPRSTRGQAA